MKKIILLSTVLMTLALLCVAGVASAQNGASLSVPTVTVDAGGSTNIDIYMTNSRTDICALQTDVFLPEGVTPQMGSDGNYLITAASRVGDTDDLFLIKKMDDNNHYIAALISKEPISGTNGKVLSIPVNVARSLSGTLQGRLEGIVYYNRQGSNRGTADNVTFNIKVNAPEQSQVGGSFYLYNPASGLFFCAGNEWGTQASLGEHGLDVELMRLNDGTYTINTQIDNGNNDRYLRAFDEGSVYCDQPATPWTMQERSDGTVTLATNDGRYLAYDGSSTMLTLTTNASDAKARWQLKTKDELIRQLSNASANNPKDATFLLPGASFSRNDLRNLLWEDSPTVGGEVVNMCGEKFNTPFDVYQELTGVPNGTYKVQAQGFYREGADENFQIDPAIELRQSGSEHLYANLYANSSSTPLKSMFDEAGWLSNGGTYSPWGNVPNTMDDASQCFSAGLFEHTVTVKVTDGKLRIGVRKDEYVMYDWTIFDNFRLTYYGMADITVENITFADSNVKSICVQNWDTNGDGELSKNEAAAVTNLGQVFNSNTTIRTFNELQYFTGLNTVGASEFFYCSNLSSITLPNTVTSIGLFAFAFCKNLKSFVMPQSLKSIGKQAFAYSGLTSITIPSSVTDISEGVFFGCSSLKNLSVNSGNTVYDSRGNCNAIIKSATNELIQGCQITVIPNTVTSIGTQAFEGFKTLTNMNIPSSVSTIGERAFEETGLISITIPNSVKTIGDYAFYNCKSLSEVHSMITVPFAINDNVFQNYNNGYDFTNATLYVPQGTKSKYKATTGWKNFINIVELDSGNWTDILLNGNLSGDDMRCFYTKVYPSENILPSTVTSGAIKINSPAKVSEDWDTQFWVRLPQFVPDGTNFKFSFEGKASPATSLVTEFHNEPSDYLCWNALGDINLSTTWKSYEFESSVPDECGGRFHSIAFNLTKSNDVVYYFRNFKFEIPSEAVTEPDFPEIVNPGQGPSIDVYDVDISQGYTATATINLRGIHSDCMAAGFVLEMPEGAFLTFNSNLWYDLSLDDRFVADHLVASKQLNSKTVKVAVYSPTNSVFQGDNCASMLRLSFKAYGMKPGVYQGKLKNIELALKNNQLIMLSDATFNVNVGNTVTNIQDFVSDEEKEDVWYDLNGRRLLDKPSTKGVYIKNGKKVIVK